MRVYVAEKPSVARAIAESLGTKTKKDGYIECKDGSIVTYCFGHLLQLAEPDTYLPDDVPLGKNGTKIWRIEDLPIIPEKWKKTVSSDKKKQVKIIKDLLKTANEIVNCGDPDREGQLLVDEVISYCGYKGKVLRYWQSAMDSISVARALKNIVPNEKYYAWGLSAEARSRADWLYGMNFSRQLTILKHTMVSVGRVQSPVLKIVVDRDLAIENFKAKNFYNLDAEFITQNQESYIGRLEIPEEYLDSENQLTDPQKVQELKNKIGNNQGIVTQFKKEQKKTNPKMLYTLADLQVECSKMFGLSAQKTLDIAQELYETHKLTTYPRTSCEFLPSAQQNDVQNILKNLSALKELQPYTSKATNIANNKVFNDKKVEESAHTGLAPTPKPVTQQEIDSLSDIVKKVYFLIVKRYVACFMQPYIYNEYSIITNVNNFIFKTTYKEPVSLGFKELDKDDEVKVISVPKLQENMPVKIKNIKDVLGTTTPPKYFTEGTLIQAMKNVAKYIDDKEEKKILKETEGIGTEATRASIIERLKKHGFLTAGTSGKTKGKIISTPQGREVIKVIPQKIKSPALTAHDEEKLIQIQNNELKLNDFINFKIKEMETIMSEISQDQTQISSADDKNVVKCPKCGEKLWRNESKFNKGQFYFRCSNKECNSIFNDVNGKPVEPQKKEYEKCPRCGSNLYHNESKTKKGLFYFHCSNKECNAFFDDVKGKPVEQQKKEYEKCPRCGSNLYHNEFKNKKGQYYFHCSNKDCNAFFDDVKGKPVEQKQKK